MSIHERINIFERLFDELQYTNSRLDKEAIVAEFREDYPELQDDWMYILETLDGKHPIGWTFQNRTDGEQSDDFESITQMIQFCEMRDDTTRSETAAIERTLGELGSFIQPIVNRTLRLGIGKSLLDKTILTPMLAKKYEGENIRGLISVTEKLDGNRCIAHHDGQKWNFTSRSGKPLNVNFDMSGLNTCFIFDGEIMSDTQTDLSKERVKILFGESTQNISGKQDAQLQFNQTSGLINRKGIKTGLVYNIFDVIVSDWTYIERRDWLNNCMPTSPEVRILPVLYTGNNVDSVNRILDTICDFGGEGIMLNDVLGRYEHKRSGVLLKYKKVQTIDMMVVGTCCGKGKYENVVGNLICVTTTEDGKKIYCEVGSGLSDEQRCDWQNDNTLIMNKIIEVAYHEITQDRHSIGTKTYSLRFPRLKSIRADKNTTSEY